MADRVERLTNLLALLLETVEPLSLVEIGAELAGQYPDKQGARRASFERDKAALREIGVPIETEIIAGGPYAGQTRYWIDRRLYELSDLDLHPDEVRALQVAVATVRSDAGKDGLWKLGGSLAASVDEPPPLSAVVPDRPELPLIREAVSRRAAIRFSYRGDHRQVDPWGLLLRGGFWYVIGHDHDRGERRTFRVDRMDGGNVEVGDPSTFVRPAGFDPRTAFPADPKQIGHDPADASEATVLIDAVRATAIERELGSDRVTHRRDDGSIEVLVPAGNVDAFRSWMLGLLDHAVVLGPAEARSIVVDWLTAIARGAA
ncbi:MAG: WYL domain-containing protein [Acidimicrobiia bacterium]|nr:WYL domain-containing protein [Acidimicrobiia bacterium]